MFPRLAAVLGPWTSPLHRRAAMLELLRVLGGFEASWHWREGVDVTNATSVRNRVGQETGVFQVSYDSLNLDNPATHELRACVQRYLGAAPSIDGFLAMMKTNHAFAFEYAARLLRNNFLWDGPIKRHEVDPWLSRAAVAHFMTLLTDGQEASPSSAQ